jgi:hypothetical protein
MAIPYNVKNSLTIIPNVPDRRLWAQQALSSCQCEIRRCCGCIFIIINCAHVKCRMLKSCECVYLFGVTLCLVLF